MLRLFHRRARLVSTIHNIYEGGRLRMLAYRISDCLAHRTTAVSHAVAQRFVRSRAVGSGKIIVLTNAIHTAHFIPDKERRAAMRARMGVADEFVWITVGRLAPAKDLNNLLAAFGQVSSQICSQASHPNPQLWIAGQPPSGTFEPHNLPIPDTARAHIRWLGLRRDIPALLDAADAFVLASAWEGMPLALGEAMAMAKPVVATDVGGVRELVGDAGLLVPAKDPDALASVLLAVMQQPEPHRSALGTRARVRILRDFDMDSRAGQWEALYQAVMGHSRARGPVVP
jgi:glycosyltransferase involved in cell wall biosynthesis